MGAEIRKFEPRGRDPDAAVVPQESGAARRSAVENHQFGRYLRKIREDRRLSLLAVEEMTLSYRARVTKSQLSRIENGQAVPSMPRMFALSQVYGIPISSLAEKYEIDLRRDRSAEDLGASSDDEILAKACSLRRSGLYTEALHLYESLIDRAEPAEPGQAARLARLVQLRLNRVTCLHHLAKYVVAKEECEDLLSLDELNAVHKITTLLYFTMSCYRLSKLSVALMGLDQINREIQAIPVDSALHGQLALLRGNLMVVTGRAPEALAAYHRALREFERLSDPFEACRVRLNMIAALMDTDRKNEARHELTQVLQDARAGGYDRHLALATGTLGVLAFDNGELDSADFHCQRSNALARPRDYHALVFRNCYYLWKIGRIRGAESVVKSGERTLRTYLSRVEQFMPEVEAYRRYLAEGARR